MNWTDEQKSAIEFRENKNLLLAAAAGSGKTAVLVERILKLITDEKNPVKLTSLLVLTFTDAAASEMKRKIKSAINKALEKAPENKHLQMQSLLISSASVSTIDSFCKKKLAEYIHLTDIVADFSIISDMEANLLLKQATDEVLEKYYSRIDALSSFKELCISIGNAKNNLKLKETLISLYKFSESLPYPSMWLADAVKNYKEIKDIGYSEKWQTMYKRELTVYTEDLKEYINLILDIISNLPKDHKYYAFYSAECEVLLSMLKEFTEDGFRDSRDIIKNYKFPAKIRVQNICPYEEKMADDIRELIKDIFYDMAQFLKDEKEAPKELSESLYKRAKTLRNILLLIGRKYKKLKREKGGLDFSDLEHEFLKLISDKNHQPTQIALELREKYTEILLDEYQDTNYIQDEIFRLISRDNKNIFMVGDLKQSIYKFRNAMPKLFKDKYSIYGAGDDAGSLIRLFKNFRSRKEVVSTVNYIFSGIMTEELGDVQYTEDEYLIQGAEYPESEDDMYNTEFCLIKKPDEDDASIDLKEAEARFIGRRIRELKDSGFLVYDTKKNVKRPIEYRDIVVLLRNRTSAPMIESCLEENGIPTFTDTGKSYLSSREVATVIAFLNIIDNPYQDIPLIAVLKSPFFSFTNEELAKVRVLDKNSYFYDALCIAGESGDEKAKNFIEELDFFRSLSEENSIYRLILTIYEKYNYFSVVNLMSFPEQRCANLRLLLIRALEFEKSKMTGLFGFLSYIDSVKEEKKDLSPAKIMSESENVVRIMTIHKSKGLEFPVIFLSDTAHKFNETDARQSVLWHEDAGISLSCTDTKMRLRYRCLSETLLKTIKQRELKSEEMRLLYVALTRAKEKLIITSAFNKKAKNVKMPPLGREKRPVCAYLKKMGSFADWIIPSLLTHPGFSDIRELFGIESDIVSTNADFRLCAEILEAGQMEKLVHEEEKVSEEKLPDFSENLLDIIKYKPEENEKIPLKVTVSEVKRRLAENDEYSPRLVSAKNIYLKKKSDFSAAEKGTITHFILQYIDEKKINSVADLETALDKAEKENVISNAQREVLDTEKIMNFLTSPLGKRLKNSVLAFKEFSFYSEKKAGEIYEGLSDAGKEKQILLQGTVDCFFEEKDGRIVLIDYKTDNIAECDAEDRALMYKIQIECYKEALEKINKRKVDESYIYFLNCNKAVEM